METTFTEKQLIDFGNYLLSGERKKRFIQSARLAKNIMESPLPASETMKQVHHADLANWKEKQNAQQ